MLILCATSTTSANTMILRSYLYIVKFAIAVLPTSDERETIRREPFIARNLDATESRAHLLERSPETSLAKRWNAVLAEGGFQLFADSLIGGTITLGTVTTVAAIGVSVGLVWSLWTGLV